MECRSLSQAELAKSVGMPSSVVSEVLAGKRALSKANITKLADYFGVKVDVFL
jgi:antitoxin component HigA of HigAB toxin-antitoxin module